jgi:hypothetical protein
MAKITTEAEKFSREQALPSQYDFDAILAMAGCQICCTGRKYSDAATSVVVFSLSAKVQKYIQNISSKCSMC